MFHEWAGEPKRIATVRDMPEVVLVLREKQLMRVAMVSFDAGEYGVQVANAICDHADVMLLSPRDRVEPYASKLNPKVETYFYDMPRIREAPQQLVAMTKLRKALARFRPDVVHVQHVHLWFSLWLPTLRKYPLVITVHDPVHHVGDAESARTPQRLVHWGYRRADELITHAEQLKSVLVDDIHLPADRVTVIPHVAISSDGPDATVAERGKRLLFFGRIWEYKGLEYLIRAEPLISARIPDVEIVIAGRGEDFDKYRRMMVNPSRFVVDNELIPEERVAQHFGEASVVVLPYIDASQSGVVPIAYSFNRPVVATSVGGLPSVVEDGVTGLLVPPRDEHALADALITLLENDDLRHKMGVAGRNKLEREWAPEVIGPQHIDVYERALRSHRS
jgi:glycosyltransferase involved in cell wall biosynthesis